MYDFWFTQHKGNVGFFDQETLSNIKDTMKSGGWYRADLIADKLTLLAFNSLQFNLKSV